MLAIIVIKLYSPVNRAYERNDVIEHPQQMDDSVLVHVSRNQTDPKSWRTTPAQRDMQRDVFPLLFSIPLYTLITRHARLVRCLNA